MIIRGCKLDFSLLNIWPLGEDKYLNKLFLIPASCLLKRKEMEK